MEEMKPEESYRAKIDKWLEAFFYIEREVNSVQGRCIDYVLTCNTSGVMFGLEVKKNGQFRGVEAGKYLKQAQDYTTHEWITSKGAQRLPIFISPAISNSYKEIRMESLQQEWENAFSSPTETYVSKHHHLHEHSNMNSLIGHVCGVGEIRKIVGFGGKKCVAFCYMNKIIWRSDSAERLHIKNYKFYFNEI